MKAETPEDGSVVDDARGSRPDTSGRAGVGRRAEVSGAVAAAVALGISELVGALSGSGPSLITSVGSRFIDLGAGSLKNVAVQIFGTKDKPALIVGIVAVCLVAGALIGRGAVRHQWIAAAGFAAFGLLAFVISLGTPLTSVGPLVLAAVAGTVSGVATLVALLTLATPSGSRSGGAGRGGRRQFLLAAGGAGILAWVSAVAGRQVRAADSVLRSRLALALPSPISAVPTPAEQPFEVPGLSPYVVPAADFYRIDTALLVPQVDVADWQVRIRGLVERPFSLSYRELINLGLIEEPVTLACVSNKVGGDLVGNAVWRGVPLKALLDRAGVQPGATQIVGRSVDGFTVGFPTAVALDGRTAMVAVGMNGSLLPTVHGFPARLVVAGLYGYVSATKWLSDIELTRLEEFDAYWVPRGWAKEAPIKTESRIDVPRDGATVPGGQVTIAGVAWAPSRGITKVEVQIDSGDWQVAELGRVASANTWVQWRYQWAAERGRHQIAVRATDGTGVLQTAQERPPEPDGASGYHVRRVVVS